MLDDLNKLATQIDVLAAMIQSLRDENQSLRALIAHTEQKNQDYKQSLVNVRERVEHIIQSLPGQKTVQ